MRWIFFDFRWSLQAFADAEGPAIKKFNSTFTTTYEILRIPYFSPLLILTYIYCIIINARATEVLSHPVISRRFSARSTEPIVWQKWQWLLLIRREDDRLRQLLLEHSETMTFKDFWKSNSQAVWLSNAGYINTVQCQCHETIPCLSLVLTIWLNSWLQQAKNISRKHGNSATMARLLSSIKNISKPKKFSRSCSNLQFDSKKPHSRTISLKQK